jgi:uncharacterized protein YjiS (DUF1127 family)
LLEITADALISIGGVLWPGPADRRPVCFIAKEDHSTPAARERCSQRWRNMRDTVRLNKFRSDLYALVEKALEDGVRRDDLIFYLRDKTTFEERVWNAQSKDPRFDYVRGGLKSDEWRQSQGFWGDERAN